MWIVVVLIIGTILVLGITSLLKTNEEAETAYSSNSVVRMKRECLRLNPKYSNSIKCKYCEHFNADGCFCHVYPGGTSPEDACDRFSLPLFVAMGCAIEAADGREFTRRPDGTYMVDLHNASK